MFADERESVEGENQFTSYQDLLRRRGGDWLNLIAGHRYGDPDHPGDELLNWVSTRQREAITDQSEALTCGH